MRLLQFGKRLRALALFKEGAADRAKNLRCFCAPLALVSAAESKAILEICEGLFVPAHVTIHCAKSARDAGNGETILPPLVSNISEGQPDSTASLPRTAPATLAFPLPQI